jgi:type IV secretion system protein VirB3
MTRHPFFRGCTKPPMVWGVPLVPFVAAAGTYALLALWSFVYSIPPVTIAISMVFAVVYLWMRDTSRKDEHRLGQRMLRWRLRGRNRNQKHWGTASLAPRELKKWKP